MFSKPKIPKELFWSFWIGGRGPKLSLACLEFQSDIFVYADMIINLSDNVDCKTKC